MSISDAEIGKVHNQVKSPWFLEINPNGRIPAITHEGTRIFETSAILVYLAQIFDKERKFSKDPSDLKAWAEEQSWIYFSVRKGCLVCSRDWKLTTIRHTAWGSRAHARPGQSLQPLCTREDVSGPASSCSKCKPLARC
jgi:glutathione S-transferase